MTDPGFIHRKRLENLGRDDVQAALDAAIERMRELGDLPAAPVVPVGVSATDDFDRYHVRYYGERRERVPYQFGFPTLDRLLGGVSPITVINGMPGQGKTTFAVQVMEANLDAGTPVLFLSFDISRREVINQFLRRFSGVPTSLIMANVPGLVFPGEFEHSLSDEQRLALGHAIDRLQSHAERFYIMTDENDGELTYETIAARIEALAVANDGRRPLVVIDYLKSLADRIVVDRNINPYDAAMNLIHSLATRLDCPWLVLSQRSRANYGNPGLDGGKGSGEIEARAYTVMSLDKRMDVPDMIDYPDWVKSKEDKAKYVMEQAALERGRALLEDRHPNIVSKLILHINKDREALGNGAAGAGVRLTLEHGWLKEEPLPPKVALFGRGPA